MQFKINNTAVKISFSFIAVILAFLLSNKAELLLTALLSAVLHELGHLVAIKLFKADIVSFSLTVFGADIKRGYKSDSMFEETIINLSGPAVNLLITALFCLLQFRFKNHDLSIIIKVNFLLFVYNMLPFYSFDGGNALKLILSRFIKEAKAEKIMTVLSYLVLIFFAILALFAFKSSRNYIPAIISVYFLLSLLFKK